MAAGTLTLVNGSDAIVGTGTDFTTLGAGDYIFCIVAGTPYTMPVRSVANATGITVTASFTGPNSSGVPWEHVPQNVMSFIGAALGIQSAEALRQLNNDKDNWLQVFSSTEENITVRIGNGLEFTGPSWKHISDLLNTLDPEALQALAAEIDADAQQVATDTATVTAAAEQVAADAAQTAADRLATADDRTASANSASAAQLAEANAETAEANAATWAQSVDPDNLMRGDRNLLEITDPPLARQRLNFPALGIGAAISALTGVDWQQATILSNTVALLDCASWINAPAGLPTTGLVTSHLLAVSATQALIVLETFGTGQRRKWSVFIGSVGSLGSRTFGVQELPNDQTKMSGGYLGQREWQDMRSAIEPGTAPLDGQVVSPTGQWAALHAKGVAGRLPVTDEATWQADPTMRGCYVLDIGDGNMRLPDVNGVQAGSLKIPVLVGDGGVGADDGKIGESALPNIKGTFTRNDTNSALARTTSLVDGAFWLLPREPVSPPTSVASTGTLATGVPLGFSAELYDPIYQDDVTEVRANRVFGCWTVRYATAITNEGQIDALQLATDITNGDAVNAADIVATNARIDFAVIDAGTMAINTGQLVENPFGNNTPVTCEFQAYHPVLLKWISVNWQAYSTSSISGGRAFYSEGRGIVIRTGQHRIFDTNQMAALQEVTTTIAASTVACPVRILVTKVTA